jgi:tRNA-splicing ligase RtcB (3'-phosphate/5'-hydroxy nucleic acid ligase)
MSQKSKLRGKDLSDMGYLDNEIRSLAMQIVGKGYKHTSIEQQLLILRQLIDNPKQYITDTILSPVANKLIADEIKAVPKYEFSKKDFAIFGADGIDENTFDQMKNAMSLPITVAGALMPDAHYGYGLPIGGVLATENAVIPYGVGMDIACRMCLSVFDMPAAILDNPKEREQLKKIMLQNTRFGLEIFTDREREDALLEKSIFREIPLLRSLHQKAADQIGSSGGGNHFVDIGVIDIQHFPNEFNLPIGKYMAVLSHSGSRGTGAAIAQHYTKIAMQKRQLPKEIAHLAWLGMEEQEGQEYWAAMELAGEYASANHHHIHRRIAKALQIQPTTMIENHHNFAWKETHFGKEMIVHRKGATPAGKGELGIIPGSMTTPAYIVKGRGNDISLKSASHGAGRLMSRRKALDSFTGKMMRDELKAKNVELIGGGIDEAPFVYKDINAVMQAQTELVDILAAFQPRLVRMAQDSDDGS